MNWTSLRFVVIGETQKKSKFKNSTINGVLVSIKEEVIF
jgi:hypothetical protein